MRWSDREAIGQLKARYCRYIDTKQWDCLPALFTDDAVFEGLGSAPDGAGVAQFVAGLRGRLATALTVHHCHMPELQAIGPDSVRGIWAMMDYLQWPEPIHLREIGQARGFTGYGHYEEEYRRVNGIWKIAFLRLTRLRVDPLMPAPPLPDTARLRAHAPGWLPGLAG